MSFWMRISEQTHLSPISFKYLVTELCYLLNLQVWQMDRHS